MSTRIIIISAVASVPWEWIRMYQNEVAKKASTLYQGVPAECLPQDIGVWLSIKSWLSWQFTWGHDPCYKYHHALIVDPVWEVTPVMAVCAAVTRCLTKPLEIIATGVGQSLQRLFTEIPSPWQPVILISVLLITVLFLIMICNYRFSIPLFMSLEPKRRDMPPRRRSSRIKAANSTNKYNNLSLCATPKNKRIVDN
uniref:Chloride channel CLIC-like protein 1 n=1 Tax=Saccoglossus kowalevskii TaxID=10224 RepID=A0ABM0MGV6_SACKO|nr:PREDICTED: chloride channel CLIC-like protein 1-like [Saccoglossus kowalevskii]